jgi:hypothetical protein
MAGEGEKLSKSFVRIRSACFLLAVLLLLTNAACMSGGRSLRLEPAAPPKGEMPYRLILYGGIGPDDFETMAVLDREDDRYRIVSYTGDIAVKVREGLPAAQALNQATGFLKRQNTFRDAEIMAITGPEGHVLGYEIRPLYRLLGDARGDAIDTSYVLGPEDTVTFYVFLRRRFWKGVSDGFEGSGGILLRK